MNILAKMKCEQVIKTEFGETVKLTAVTADSEENKSFSKWTPSAHAELTITNPAAAGAFVPGAEYLLTFTPAAK